MPRIFDEFEGWDSIQRDRDEFDPEDIWDGWEKIHADVWDVIDRRKFYRTRWRPVVCVLCDHKLVLVNGEWKHRWMDRYTRYCWKGEQRGLL